MRIFSRFALLSSSLFFMLLIGNVMQARGASLFDNYSSSGFETNVGSTISGSGSSLGTYLSPSVSFTSDQTANLSDIYAPFGWVSGTNGISLFLENNNNGSPGSIIESWSLSNFAALGTNFTPQPIPSISNPLLTSGVTYWLVATPGDNSTWAAWNLVKNSSSPAFAVNGTPVQSQNTPEPGVLATLMSMGMASGGVFLRKFRKA